MRRILFLLLLLATTGSGYAQTFIQRQGKKLFYQGSEIHLRGMAFGNLVWVDNASPASHHSEIDLERVHDLGMNTIRFYMNYKTFEDDAQPYTYKQSGWDWIDTNIQWAKAHGIFLILNMHVPQGGFQSQCQGTTLWSDPTKQQRLAALWKAIAQHYKDEPQIAGFDLVNEPTPTGTVQKWSTLAQRIIDSIRVVDQNHLIITERAIALDCNYGYQDANNNYPQITENNLMYTVHLYDPYEFTHQNLAWAGTGDGGRYPDNEVFTTPSDIAYATGDYDNPSIATGTNDWTYFTGTPFTVNHDSILLGRVVFLSNKIGAGTIYFDDLEVKELDLAGNVTKVIYDDNLSSGTYWLWTSNGTGSYATASIGHNDNYSISITGNTANATVSCANIGFKVSKNKRYVVSGWMKGDNLPAGASASISIEYYHSPSHAPLVGRNYEYLKSKVVNYAQYIENAGFPVYFGEFGAARTAFVNNKGGAQWVADAMHLFDSLGYHFTYHSYKESSFGYYDGWDQPVDVSTVNTELTTVFKSFFGLTASVEKEGMEVVKNSIQLFPNPSREFLTVVSDSPLPLQKVEVLDLLGNVVLISDQPLLDVRHLAKGTYLIKVSRADGWAYGKCVIME